MAGKSSIEIVESKAELQNKLKQERNAKYQQKLQVLYLMKVEGMSVTQIAASMGKNRTTIHRWLEQYQNGGIAEMLTTKPKSGRPRQIPVEAVAKLKEELEQGEGFSSYKQVQAWLAEQLGVEARYRTVHQLTRYRLKAKLKVARPKARRQPTERLEAFKKTLEQTYNNSRVT